MPTVSDEVAAALAGGQKTYDDTEPGQSRTGPWPPAGKVECLFTGVECWRDKFRRQSLELDGTAIQFTYELINDDETTTAWKGAYEVIPDNLDEVVPQLDAKMQRGVRGMLGRIMGGLAVLNGGEKPASLIEGITTANKAAEKGVLLDVTVRLRKYKDKDGNPGEAHTDYINGVIAEE